jgi:SSS family solute:Na+ symporter
MLYRVPSIYARQIMTYTLHGTDVTPQLVATLVWRRATAARGVIAILTRAIVTLAWEFALDKPLGWNARIVALAASVLVLAVVSLLTSSKVGRLADLQANASARIR